MPSVVKSAKGVEGQFTDPRYSYRIDTNKVAQGEGGFHIHIFREDKCEIAKVSGTGRFVKSHKRKALLKPSQIHPQLRRDINRLIRHVRKNLHNGRERIETTHEDQ
ncbi:MAG: hypothetical protein DRI57_10555 [Deltaproteobacteria bacterium]|nr:MAG: hypothetical protein DRI57_10555 [Deltaproteobacteria bacterium]